MDDRSDNPPCDQQPINTDDKQLRDPRHALLQCLRHSSEDRPTCRGAHFRNMGIAAFFLVALVLLHAHPTVAQQKLLTKEQVVGLVSNQLGDESGVKVIELRGLDFDPSPDFLHTLKDSGASETFVQAVRAAGPLPLVKILALLGGQVANHRVAMLVEQRGIGFEPTEENCKYVEVVGGDSETIKAIREARRPPPLASRANVTVDHQQLREYVIQGIGMDKQKLFREAEREYRAALRLDQSDASIHALLGFVLTELDDWTAATTEFLSAVSNDPGNPSYHSQFADALKKTGHLDRAITEYSRAVDLQGDDALPQDKFEALDKALTHENLADALWTGGRAQRAIAEYRVAVRMQPDSANFRYSLALALGASGDHGGAIEEYARVLGEKPDWAEAHAALGLEFISEGDLRGATSECQRALALAPEDATAHCCTGMVFIIGDQWDKAQNEFVSAEHLDPNSAEAHAGLGVIYEHEGDKKQATAEYRSAHLLQPENEAYRAIYERLLQDENK